MKTALAYSSILIIIIVIVLGGGVYYYSSVDSNTPKNRAEGTVVSEKGEEKIGSPVAIIETNYGTIRFEMYEKDAPKTVENFMTLARKGFYDGLTFHRVIKGFMIQGGDPLGNGTGGPGYTFEDELNPETESYKRGYVKGTVAMANAGPNTNGSQFFIMHEDTPLPHSYTIFGHVIEGQEVVDAIARVETDANDKPIEPVIIKTVTVEEK